LKGRQTTGQLVQGQWRSQASVSAVTINEIASLGIAMRADDNDPAPRRSASQCIEPAKTLRITDVGDQDQRGEVGAFKGC
jgi:hypothetical protein